MQHRLFLTLLLGLLFFWFLSGLAIEVFMDDLPRLHLRFLTERSFGALVHSIFLLAVILTLVLGYTHLKSSKIAVMAAFFVFVLLIYFFGVWSSMLAAFVRAPWAKRGERGPAISAPSAYSLYTWEWEMGPNGVDK